MLWEVKNTVNISSNKTEFNGMHMRLNKNPQSDQRIAINLHAQFHLGQFVCRVKDGLVSSAIIEIISLTINVRDPAVRGLDSKMAV